uniref:Uncharacterized protein n=1 Tax=Knipowitschia caucasica TaxID=637954 RepID=A0AAV2KL51_KNICA
MTKTLKSDCDRDPSVASVTLAPLSCARSPLHPLLVPAFICCRLGTLVPTLLVLGFPGSIGCCTGPQRPRLLVVGFPWLHLLLLDPSSRWPLCCLLCLCGAPLLELVTLRQPPVGSLWFPCLYAGSSLSRPPAGLSRLPPCCALPLS